VKGLFQHMSETLLGRLPWDEALIDQMREEIRTRCSAVPVHVHSRQRAEFKIAEAAKEAVVHVLQKEFPNSIRPIVVSRDWPWAECWISDDEALIRFSFSPETDDLMGGVACEPVRIVVTRAPPGLMKRMTDAMLKRREPDLAPVGTPHGKPELKLNKPLPAAKPKAPEAPKASRKLPAKATLRKL
jgi:hypothetical protein